MENASQTETDLLFQNMEINVAGGTLAISLYPVLFGFADLFIRRHHPGQDLKNTQKNVLRHS